MPSISKAPAGPEAGYWRSLAQLQGEPNPELGAEFTPEMMDELDSPSRRRFIQLMGASVALAGAVGCSKRHEKIIPAVKSVPGRVLGQTVPYTSAAEINGVGYGLLVNSYDGRPIKIDGNPKHPTNKGACNVHLTASMLEMYDPDRSTHVTLNDKAAQISTWDAFQSFLKEQVKSIKAKEGTGLAILAGSTSSPTLLAAKDRLLKTYKNAKWYEYEPVSRDTEREGTKLVFSQPVRPIYNFTKAKIVCSLGADLFGSHPAAMQYTRDFASRRGPEDTKADQFSRLYVFESAMSATGAVADHRVPMKASAVGKVARAIFNGLKGTSGASGLSAKADKVIAALVEDLKANKGASVVTAGYQQPAEVHALVQQINASLLGAVGTTVTYVADPDGDRGTHADAISALAAEAAAGKVETLLILGGNPVYNAPADLKFGEVLKKVGKSIHVGLYLDETGSACSWHLPQAHFLESWGDVRAWDGTLSITQPIIEPLYKGKSFAEVLSLVSEAPSSSYDLVRAAVKPILGDAGFEAKWQAALKDGFVPTTEFKSITPKASDAAIKDVAEVNGLEAVFIADSKVFDGRHANNAWLQELPDFATKLVWDNAVLVSTNTAKKLNVEHSDLVTVKVGEKEVAAAVYIQPGQATDSVTLILGYGRTVAGVVGGRAKGVQYRIGASKASEIETVGFDFYPLRNSKTMNFVGDVKITPRGGKHNFAITQDHHQIDTGGMRERDQRADVLVRETTIAEFDKNRKVIKHKVHELPLLQLFTGPQEEKTFKTDHKWGMTIDMSKCVGCNACVTACQSENNIPVVGKDQVRRGREMQWMRIDRYFRTEDEVTHSTFEDVAVYHQPLTCMHCENAPCEQVCPVAATVHSAEGTNDMVYNRCVGTRYCSNNCPYKVRRFNFYNWHAPITDGPDANEVMKMIFNPDVTVRSRGVMEKCTYCIHRIRSAKIRLKNEAVSKLNLKKDADQPLKYEMKDGEVVTACQQVCPAGAITFGDLQDKKSKVAQLQESERAYGMLAEMNLRPRTLYLARIRNPHPSLETKKADHHDHPVKKEEKHG